MNPTCGCEALPAHPRTRATVTLDRAGLRQALGGRAEVIEALEPKASGRAGANAGRLWHFLTTSLYTSGDLPVIATREALLSSILILRGYLQRLVRFLRAARCTRGSARCALACSAQSPSA